MPINHILIKATAAQHADLVTFYTALLKPLGLTELKRFPNGFTGFGDKAPELWIGINDEKPNTNLHFAFTAPSREAVEAFHAAAIAGGATDNGAPGPRTSLHPDYFATFIIDPAGNNIEAGVMIEGGAAN